MPNSIYARAALAFAMILLVLGILLGWFGYVSARRHQHEILQQANRDLASHIADQLPHLGGGGSDSTEMLFNYLMAVNPNIEVYLLDANGRVLHASKELGRLQLDRVDLRPVAELMRGATLPIFGDNPRHVDGREIFSAAPRHGRDGTVIGYVYIVLLNDQYRDLMGVAWRHYVTRTTAWIAALAVLAALTAGLVAFAMITRRLQGVTRDVEAFAAKSAAPQSPPSMHPGDEIDRLAAAFGALRRRLQVQMEELQRQDELRRELIANVSHDLRTPLTSMQGYLEMMARMNASLSTGERGTYLDIAVRQSHKVTRLAQQLFELAQLEYQIAPPLPERFSLGELMQDIAHKYALTARQKQLRLTVKHDNAASLYVHADIGMIERVIGNLLDNAIRHTPQDGEVRLQASAERDGVTICVADTGEGIASEHLPTLMSRESPLRQMASRRVGGLGLLIAKRILDLHDSELRVTSVRGTGTQVSFRLPARDIVAPG